MAYELKEMSGSLFPNDKEGNDSRPDFTGNIKINGKVWRIAAWDTESRNGQPYMSLKITDPDAFKRQQEGRGDTPKPPSGRLTDEDFQRRRRQSTFRPSPETDFSDDDIPF